jgi:drug/metabolite transporter (DMT)-like permease
VVAVILAWLLLGETLSLRAQAGAALIVCAVVVMTAGAGPLRALRGLSAGLRFGHTAPTQWRRSK